MHGLGSAELCYLSQCRLPLGLARKSCPLGEPSGTAMERLGVRGKPLNARH
jgi:hypothetical protein